MSTCPNFIFQLKCHVSCEVLCLHHPCHKWENDTLYTDKSGHFEKDRLKYSWPDEVSKARVKFEDVDGDANGRFETKILKRDQLKVKQTKKTDDFWNKGDFTIEAKAVLNKKK